MTVLGIRIAIVVLAGLGLLVAGWTGSPAAPIFFLAYGGVGAYLAGRRPRSPVGWLLLVMAWGLAVGSATVGLTTEELAAGSLDTATRAAAWGSASGWTLVFAAFMGLVLTFPDGHLPSGRWRRAIQLAAGVVIAIVVAITLRPTIGVTATEGPGEVPIANPLALAPDVALWALVPGSDFLYATLFGLFLVATLGLLRRAWRSSGVARLQYRWFVASIVLVAIQTMIWVIAVVVLRGDPQGPVWWLVVLSYPSVPVAIAIAVTRYRLFEIDRVVSRTIGWTVVSGTLVAVFGVLVVGLQALLTGLTQGRILTGLSESDSLVVAISTLAAFALFQPVRGRVQAVVDRRFDRARVDGQRTIAAFDARLRDEVDLPRLQEALIATADQAVRPVTASLWLRPGQRAP